MFSLDDVFYIMYIYFLEVLNTNCITFSNYLVGNYLRKYSYLLQRTWFGLSRYMNKLSCFWNNFRGNFRLINNINNQLCTFYFSSKVLIDTYFMVTLLDTIYCVISTYLYIDLNLLLWVHTYKKLSVIINPRKEPKRWRRPYSQIKR